MTSGKHQEDSLSQAVIRLSPITRINMYTRYSWPSCFEPFCGSSKLHFVISYLGYDPGIVFKNIKDMKKIAVVKVAAAVLYFHV